MATEYTLSERDHNRIERMLRWFERTGQKLTQRRRQILGAGKAGGTNRRAQTQEVAQADQYISVKFLDADGNPYGDAFDAECIFTDGATAADTCLPDMDAANETILISQIDGTWYIVNPTFIDSTVCS